MSEFKSSRGDGIGIEFTPTVLRGVRLAHDEAGHLRAAAEVGINSAGDDTALLDSLVRLRAQLGGVRVPTRLALFPPGSALHRVEATGLAGAELNQLRTNLRVDHQISSTVLVDDGPRRWMIGVRWNEATVRRLEALVERAGFVDVAIDPSPLALARVLPKGCTVARRAATADEAFEMVIASVPCAACSVDAFGSTPPDLSTGVGAVSTGVFDDVLDPADLVVQIGLVLDKVSLQPSDLTMADLPFPPFPTHDVRAPARQCVALGAALGAAGLAGRLRPIDILMPAAERTELLERPWAIERVSTLAARERPKPKGALRRLVARVVPRKTQ
jgi:hypothetical protein